LQFFRKHSIYKPDINSIGNPVCRLSLLNIAQRDKAALEALALVRAVFPHYAAFERLHPVPVF